MKSNGTKSNANTYHYSILAVFFWSLVNTLANIMSIAVVLKVTINVHHSSFLIGSYSICRAIPSKIQEPEVTNIFPDGLNTAMSPVSACRLVIIFYKWVPIVKQTPLFTKGRQVPAIKVFYLFFGKTCRLEASNRTESAANQACES